MAARHQQQQVGKVQVVGKPGAQRMAFQVVDGEEGQGVDGGDRLRHHHADDHPADQPRPGGGGDAVEVRETEAGLRHGVRDQPVQVLEVGARRDLGHHAAEGWWSSSCERIRSATIRLSPSTMATAVSSQLVSIPRMRMAIELSAAPRPPLLWRPSSI